jgi:hypothetical protein
MAVNNLKSARVSGSARVCGGVSTTQAIGSAADD